MTGKLLAKAIREMGYTLRHAAKVSGIPYNSLRQYSSGQRPIPVKRANILKSYFGIDSNFFDKNDTYMNQSKEEIRE